MLGMASEQATAEDHSVGARRESCCSAYHQAIELIGKRWTGAILFVLLDGPLRFSEVKVLVDPSVIGGISAKVGDTVIDGTVKRRMEQLKEQVMR